SATVFAGHGHAYRCIVVRANTRMTGVRLRFRARRAVTLVAAAAQLISEPLRRRQSRIVTEMRHSARAVKMRSSHAAMCLEARIEEGVVRAAVSVLNVHLGPRAHAEQKNPVPDRWRRYH